MLSIIGKLLRGRKSEESEDAYIEDNKTSERTFIMSSVFYLSVILFIGVPMWFYTCSATRYSLPNLTNLEDKLNSQPKLHLDVSVVRFASYDAKKIDDDTSHSSDQQANYLRTHLPKQLDTSIRNLTYDIDWRVRRPTHDEFKIFQSHQNSFSSKHDNLPVALTDLESKLVKIHKPSNRFRLFIYLIEEQNYSAFCDSSRTHTFTVSFERFVYLCPSTALSVSGNYEPIVNLIKDVMNEIYTDTVDLQRAKHILNTQIDLLFSLIVKTDIIDFYSLSQLARKAHEIYHKNVNERFPELKDLINLRLITQNVVDILDDRLLSKIAGGQKVNKIKSNGTTSDIGMPTVIQVEKVDMLFHEFESRTNKHSSQNVYNVLAIASSAEFPFMFERKSSHQSEYNLLEGPDSNCMLLLNDDKCLVLGMRAVIRRVAGLSSTNLCGNCLVRRDVFFNRWEIDAIMGALAMEKLRNTFISLQSISKQVVGIKIPKDVSAMANEAHELAMKSLEQMDTKQTLESYRSASRAFELSESAFYDPSLLESLYFPDDLKYAIYLPLFLPLAFPFGVSIWILIKYLYKTWSSDRKQKMN